MLLSEPDQKAAARLEQKRCHPDVAGDQLGHDMAVLLNEAYSILSDEQLRAAYDQVSAELLLWFSLTLGSLQA